MQSTNTSQNQTETNVPGVVHQPFSWLHRDIENDSNARFMALTMDVCKGIRTCLDLVHTAGIERENDLNEGSLLDVEETNSLLRLAMVSAQLLTETAQSKIDVLTELAHDKWLRENAPERLGRARNEARE